MSTPPGGRFVRLRNAEATRDHLTATFTAADDEPAELDSHGVVAAVAATDPQRAQRIAAGLRHLMASDDAVMSWLEADPANTAAFARDPEAALRQALPGLPDGFFDAWRPAAGPTT